MICVSDFAEVMVDDARNTPSTICVLMKAVR